ncbi:unnamed protein product [Ceratitis capitata]|uniref:(Mediterranean fruit fly) hypothetical protein n=1 Tax=Ceratitis capitata TaxID=7213 RepID=A0A811UET2_CERCA|nr:unnamed protein product [Ceratitis capitata]
MSIERNISSPQSFHTLGSASTELKKKLSSASTNTTSPSIVNQIETAMVLIAMRFINRITELTTSSGALAVGTHEVRRNSSRFTAPYIVVVFVVPAYQFASLTQFPAETDERTQHKYEIPTATYVFDQTA